MYSALADIQTLIKWVTFGAASKITSTEVTDTFIPEADAHIDSKLERVYTVPITNADDIEILRYISSRFAAAEIAQVLVLQTAGEIPPIVERWLNEADSRLKQITSYEIDLPNSTKVDVTQKVFSYTAHGTDNDGNDPPEQTWKIGVDQW